MARNERSSGLMPFALALGLAALGQLLVWRPDSELGRRLAGLEWSMSLGWLLFALAGWLAWRSWKAAGGEILARAGAKSSLPRWAELAGLAAILLLSLYLRLHRLDSYPNAGFRDEGENGNVAIQIMQGEPVDGTESRFPSYIEHNTQNAAGYFYPTAVSFKLFGISITSVRYVSVFFGVASVAAFYFLARWLFGAPMGLFLAASLAMLRWHLNFSRIGFLGMMTIFLEIPVFYFLLKGLKAQATPALNKIRASGLVLAAGLAVARGFLGFLKLGAAEHWVGLAMGIPLLYYAWRARKDPQARYFMIASVALACAMYSYIAARLLILIVACVLLQALFIRAEGPRLRRWLWLVFGVALAGLAFLVEGSARSMPAVKLLGKAVLAASLLGLAWAVWGLRQRLAGWGRGLALALGLGLVVAGPLYSYTLSHWKEVGARSDRVSIYNDKEYDKRPWGAKLKEEVLLTLGMYNVRGDGNPRHNLPGEIMLNPAWAALFAIAIFYCLLRFKDERAWLVLTWWQVSLLAGYLSIEAPQAYRTLGAIPAVLIGVGLVLERGLVAARRYLEEDAWMAALPAALLLLGLGGMYELSAYFQRQPRHPGVWAEFSASEYAMGRQLKELQKEGPTRGLMRPDWSDSYTFRFMTYPERNYEYFDLARHVPLRGDDLKPGTRFLYVLGPSQLPLASMLKSIYPKGVYHEEKHKLTGEMMYWSYLISAEDAMAGSNLQGGLKASYYQDVTPDLNAPEKAPHWVKSTKRKEQVDPFLLFEWTVSPVPGFFSAEWRGRIKAPSTGAYTFWLSSNSYADLEIGGRKVCEQPFHPAVRSPAECRKSLSQGWHDIRVRYYEARNYSRMELWWKAPGGEKEIVPPQVLRPE